MFGVPVQFTMQGALYGEPALLRVDYLAPAAKGPRTVEILETLWIEPGVGELRALAFDPEGHRIACLGEGDAIEIAPVP